MSTNLDAYLNALEKSKKLNSEAEKFAELMIGARGKKIPMGRSTQMMYGRGGAMPGVGALNVPQAAPAPGGYIQAAPGNSGGGYGVNYEECGPGAMLPLGPNVGGPCPPEFLCDCDLIGVTTLGTEPIATNTNRLITVTNFDAVALQPVAIWFTAFVADAVAPNDLIATPVVEVPCIIQGVTVGQQGQLRAAGIGNALNSAAFAATREPVCIDWAPFRSQNGQELQLNSANIVADVSVHFFAVLWTNVLS